MLCLLWIKRNVESATCLASSNARESDEVAAQVAAGLVGPLHVTQSSTPDMVKELAELAVSVARAIEAATARSLQR